VFLDVRDWPQLLPRVLHLSFGAALALGLGAYGLVYFFGSSVAGFFLDDAALIHLSHQLMMLFCLGFIVMGLNVVSAGYFTALEQPLLAGGISLFRGGVLVAILLLIMPLIWSIDSIWLIPLISEILVLALSIALLKRFRPIACPSTT